MPPRTNAHREGSPVIQTLAAFVTLSSDGDACGCSPEDDGFVTEAAQ